MKRVLIVTLVCVNLGLLATLMLGTATPKASAQAFRGGTDYLLMTGAIRSDYDAVYVIDLGKRRLLAWKLDRTKKSLVPNRGRDLRNDFERQRAE